MLHQCNETRPMLRLRASILRTIEAPAEFTQMCAPHIRTGYQYSRFGDPSPYLTPRYQAIPQFHVLQVVLGTESGMITAIVRKVQQLLRDAGRSDLTVEVVFPVAPDAMVSEQTAGVRNGSEPMLFPGGLAMIPGAASGEGCSTDGGCASCPFMKMNSLQ
jgi:hypothetical protein